MSNSIIVTSENNIYKTILFNDGNPIRYNICKNDDFKIGNIYIGRVQKVKKDIGAVFVELSKDVIGFLPIKDINYKFITNRIANNNIFENDNIAVMISKEVIKTKPLTLTCNLSIQGTYSVVHSDDDQLHVSNKLDKDTKKSIENNLKTLLGDIENGVIIRTNAKSANIESIVKEITDNNAVLIKIINNINYRTCYSRIYESAPNYIDHIRNIDKKLYDKIITDNDDIYKILTSYVYDCETELYNNDSLSLKALYSLDKVHSEATSNKVYLKSGGYIIIDVCEAMTVIDVNSGKANFTEKKSSVDLVNKEAASEIVHQLILRNISGIIIIDFINYKSKEETENLISFLKKELQKDPLKSKFIDITPLGLVEITREKKYSSIYDNLKILNN